MGADMQKVDMHGQGEEGGLKTGRNVRTSFMNDPLSKTITILERTV